MSDAVHAAIAQRRKMLALAHDGYSAAEDRVVSAHPVAPHGKEQAVPPLLACFPPGPTSPGSVTPFNVATMLHFLGTALSGSISTISTVLSWVCFGIHRRGALPSPVCA